MTHHTHKLHITQTITVDVVAPKSTDASLLALAWSRLIVDNGRQLLTNITVNGLEQKVKVVKGHPADCEKESCKLPF